MADVCPSADKCPIFSGVLKGKEITSKNYRLQYCENGIVGRNNCKRWQCKNKFGKVPEQLLPNSKKTLEEIAAENNW
ncbi:MAG: hypothetical protein GXX85_00240 [Ignavibacteria bacterium]|nr:hypothetical protein [Ignavibacteria bacterium]